MAIRTIGVVGAGQMGAGIAQVAAATGRDVILQDIAPEFVEHGMATIRGSLNKFVAKGKLPAAEAEAIAARITPSVEQAPLAETDMVIEAIVEDQNIKQELFATLGQLCPSGTILASNTSSISISELGEASGRPAQFIGMHFMNPVPLMELVEVIRGRETLGATCTAVMELAREMGKTPVEANDFPGFVANRILLPMLNEACYALMEGVAEAEAIDTVMKLGMNHPMGPLALADYIGLDTCLSIMEVLHRGFENDKYLPCPLLREKVAAGHLGRKSGRGFYEYS
ncbi:MAG: 3-hydroxybutyryl-CoA dehydrogenase [Candidatus Poseidoniia archaeon]|jgi:3-hydroxybutyryl-CoA dehydrogenase|nr:3-hydroxybutyryl-CoA dehydrogenase [Candidatus Poseidoniia archaeon]MDP6659085.1 3-hydroxybutyryl-CoA dehydrogenase [Candidatus Poseidoniia archaeon]MDP6846217.1 3-hydroxybutyryl-CoA dehydrogenase [Candidatus Poseidoniia archaeon]MDP7007553.1 3-hydroxybutyryl-CoA dehydrogenase [Candidatus Poseidoniia archaeon]|tara:strand:- start:4757 stop:5608 length:852 start_codon:yes stop_codon:yes gene_type:complete